MTAEEAAAAPVVDEGPPPQIVMPSAAAAPNDFQTKFLLFMESNGWYVLFATIVVIYLYHKWSMSVRHKAVYGADRVQRLELSMKQRRLQQLQEWNATLTGSAQKAAAAPGSEHNSADEKHTEHLRAKLVRAATSDFPLPLPFPCVNHPFLCRMQYGTLSKKQAGMYYLIDERSGDRFVRVSQSDVLCGVRWYSEQ
jgi:hypothetical protein